MSGPGALSLSVSVPCSLCTPGTLSRPRRSRGALCVGARRSLALCVGARRSLCRAPALFVSGPGALCVGPRRSLAGRFLALCIGARAVRRGQGPAGPALFVSDPGALCVGALTSLCRGVALLGAWHSLALCVGARRSLCVATLSMSGTGALCVVARRSLCRSPALFVSGPGALSLSVSGPSAPSVGARHSLALCVGTRPRRSRGAVGPRRFCVGARRFFQRAVSGRGALLCRGPALSVSGPGLCVKAPVLFVSGPGALSLCMAFMPNGERSVGEVCRGQRGIVTIGEGNEIHRWVDFGCLPSRRIGALGEAGPPSERRLQAKAAAMADTKRQKGRSAGAENFEHAHQSSSKRKGACKAIIHPELSGLSSGL